MLDQITALLPAQVRPYAKALYPAFGTVLAVLVTWASTGTFDAAELRTALTGGIAAVVALLVPNHQPAQTGVKQRVEKALGR